MVGTVKIDNIAGNTADTVTIPTGQTFTITDGLPVSGGGTGQTSFTAGDLLYATGATTLTKLGKGTTEQTLKMNTGATAPEYGTTHPIAGGTGLTSYTSGDFLYADTTTSLAKLAKGSNTEVLTLASGIPSWATAPAGNTGKVLQVVQTVWDTAYSATNYGNSFTTITGATCTITPSNTSNKIWFRAMVNLGSSGYSEYLRIQRGGSDIAAALGTVSGSKVACTSYGGATHGAGINNEMQSTTMSYLDSPSSTSALTYTITGAARHVNTWTVNYPYLNPSSDDTGHAISSITLLEIDGT